MPMPVGSIIQVTQVSSPDIENILNFYANARRSATYEVEQEQRQFYQELVNRRIAFFKQSRAPGNVGMKPTNLVYLLISVKIPVCGSPPADEELEEIESLIRRVAESFNTIGLHCEPLDAAQYLFFVRRLLKMHDEKEYWYDKDLPICDQVLAPGDELTLSKRRLKFGKTNISVLSVKSYPEFSSLAKMAYLVGAPDGSENQINTPYALTLTVHFPDSNAKRAQVDRRATLLTHQLGPLARFAPLIAKKKEGIDIMKDRLLAGEIPVELSLTLVLYADDDKRLDKAVAAVLSFYSAHQFQMAEERHIHLPVLLNTLPLVPSAESIKMTYRFQTMAPSHAANFAPVLGEWQGTGTEGATLLISRRGTPLLWDLYDSPSSYNGAIVAESGGGKSFLAQRLVVDYLTKGAKVWVLDRGRSFYKLAKFLGGEHVAFSEQSNICLNPFTNVGDLDEEMETLRALVAKMAAPEQGLDDFRYSALEECLNAVWGTTGNNSTIHQVYEFISHHADERIRDLAVMLYPYTPMGAHGKWFDGENNLDFHRDLVVLETEDLLTKPTLLQVVLLQIVTKITQDFYHARDGRQKILIVDEAKSYLEDPGMARFLAAVAATVRKHNGAVVLITQSIRNFFSNAHGQDILANAPNRLILQHGLQTINWMQKDDLLGIGEPGYGALKGLKTVPGQFSEFMVAKNAGWGIARLVEDEFFQALYSTKGDAFHPLIRRVENGEPVTEVIESYLAAKRRTT